MITQTDHLAPKSSKRRMSFTPAPKLGLNTIKKRGSLNVGYFSDRKLK